MKNLLFVLSLLFCVTLSVDLRALNQPEIDSLLICYGSAKHDTTRAGILQAVGDIYNRNLPDTAIFYYRKAIEHTEKNLIRRAHLLNKIGIAYKNKGSFEEALKNYLQAVKIFEDSDDKKSLAKCYGNIGVIFHYQRNFESASEYYLKDLKLAEELNDKIGMASCFGNLGIVHKDHAILSEQTKNFDQADKEYTIALDFLAKALDIGIDLGNKKMVSTCYTNIGNVYFHKKNYDKSTEYFLNSLKIHEELGNMFGAATIYGNISGQYANLAALEDNKTVCSDHAEKAIYYGNMGIEIAREIGAIPIENAISKTLLNTYRIIGNYEKSLEFTETFISTKDSMFSEEKTKALVEMQSKYEAEKKQLQIDNLNKENALKQAELAQSEEKRNKQLILIYSFVAGFIIILVFSGIIFRMFVQKKKANRILAEQKEQIEIQNSKLNQANEEITTQRDEIEAQRDLVTGQKEHIEEQKKEIDDSIQYAKRIQTAVLPANNYAESILGEHFIIFHPHSVVSGDFYWATQTEEWTIVTVADCTGHGVPGAFMSMLGVSFLNEIVRKKDVTNTAQILNQLRASVIEALKQTGDEGTAKDGMDMSIVAIHKDRNKAMWAGANNPLYVISPKTQDSNPKTQEPDNKKDSWVLELETLGLEFKEYKGDSMPVAVHERMDNFTNHEIELNKGDLLYMFSDGYPDQFGGPIGKKFKYKPFKRLIAENCHKPMPEQKENLEATLDNWMNPDPEGSRTGGNNYEQVDDITVVGIKI